MGITTYRYFRIIQHEKVDRPELHYKREYIKGKELEEEVLQIYVKEYDNKTIEYPDIIDRPLFVVSNAFKEVVKIYNKDLEIHAVVLTGKKNINQKIYWHLKPPIINQCLSDKSEYVRNDIKKPVINRGKTEDQSFFRITNHLQTFYIVRLDLAESLIRRGLVGFKLEGLEEE